MSAYEFTPTTVPVFAGPGLLRFPFANVGDAATVIVDQAFMLRPESYESPILNTVYSSSGYFTDDPSISTAYLVGDTTPSPVDGGLVQYIRSWASVPESREEYESISATFPGIQNQRAPFTETVTAQITIDYFLVGPSQTYEDPSEIPTIPATKFLDSAWSTGAPADAFFLSGSTSPLLGTWLAGVTAEEFTYIIQASTLERWMGNIYARSYVSVRPL